MKRILILTALLLATVLSALQRYDSSRHGSVTKEQLSAFVREAVAFVGIYGKADALAEFNAKSGLFQRGELSVFAFTFQGQVLADGSNPALVGKNLINLKDPAGKPVIRDMVTLLRGGGSGWITIQWFHPLTKRIRTKLCYIVKVDDTWWLGSGSYP